MPVVIPPHQGRHGHQYGFRAPAGLQAKERPAVVDQIEFHIPAAPVELKLAFPVSVSLILAALDNGHISRQEMVADAFDQTKGLLEAGLIHVVEKKPADSSRFIPVRQEKISIAPLLIFLVCTRAERQARLAGRPMPMHDILVVRIVRGEVESAAEPPNRGTTGGGGRQKPDVAMDGGGVRIARMED